jgi:hypothetical protein
LFILANWDIQCETFKLFLCECADNGCTVAAMCGNLRYVLVVAHIALSSDKDSEIAAFQTLLGELDLQGVLVTVDAIQCQKKTSN